MKMTFLLFFFLIAFYTRLVWAELESAASRVNSPIDSTNKNLSNLQKRSRDDEVDILPPHYYRDVAPMINGEPVKVDVSVVILNLKINSGSSQEFDADIFFHNFWKDHRLQKPSNLDAIAQRYDLSRNKTFPKYKLNDKWKKRLWVPETYFRNAASGAVSNIMTPTSYFIISNYTEVFMAVRIHLKLTCDMNFSKFPFDTQKCFINITSTNDDSKTVKLSWERFRIGSHVDVSEFSIVSVRHEECMKEMDIGKFSCLFGEIVFKRNIGNYLIKRFIPSFIIVMMTFIGFWIPTNISPARISLPITALLALITQQIQSDLNVSYVYALQVWNIVSIVFVFGNLLAFAIALFVMHQAQKEKSRKEESEKGNSSQLLMIEHHSRVALSAQSRPSSLGSQWSRVQRRLVAHFRTNSSYSSVDHVARYLFPILYALFVIIFALYCYHS